MDYNYDDCIVMLLHHEGGYVNHPKDPGGETNLGVTKRVYEEYLGREVTSDEMKNLQPSDVKPLYKKFKGWMTDTSGIKEWKNLPKNTKKYINFISDFCEVKISSISTSPEREDTILLDNPFKKN